MVRRGLCLDRISQMSLPDCFRAGLFQGLFRWSSWIGLQDVPGSGSFLAFPVVIVVIGISVWFLDSS